MAGIAKATGWKVVTSDLGLMGRDSLILMQAPAQDPASRICRMLTGAARKLLGQAAVRRGVP
jgi:hypothetical protein